MSNSTMEKYGFDPESFKLETACSDFYLLEALANKYNWMKSRKDEFNKHLSTHLVNYFQYAVATELDYLEHRATISDCDGYECGESCGCDQSCSDCWNCNCSCQNLCEYCKEGCYEVDGALPASSNKILSEFFKHKAKPGTSTYDAMKKCMKPYTPQKRGEVLSAMSDVFKYLPWSAGFGGEGWGTIAGVASYFLLGKITASTYIDRCWTLKHNGDCAFDKAEWEGEYHLPTVLEIQARNQYVRLLDYASSKVRRYWIVADIGSSSSRGGRDSIWLGRHSQEEWILAQLTDEEWLEVMNRRGGVGE